METQRQRARAREAAAACCSSSPKQLDLSITSTPITPNPNNTIPPPPSAPSSSPSTSSSAAANRHYRGVRMRKWGKWVAEIREPNKRSRIWLGSYASPVAAARAYDTAVFYLRGRSARLNFPDEIEIQPEQQPGNELSAAVIRKKAAEVGARVDALHAAGMAGMVERRQREEEGERRQRVRHRNPDLNQTPSPDSSDME